MKTGVFLLCMLLSVLLNAAPVNLRLEVVEIGGENLLRRYKVQQTFATSAERENALRTLLLERRLSGRSIR